MINWSQFIFAQLTKGESSYVFVNLFSTLFATENTDCFGFCALRFLLVLFPLPAIQCLVISMETAMAVSKFEAEEDIFHDVQGFVVCFSFCLCFLLLPGD
jgi:hypothetical protein